MSLANPFETFPQLDPVCASCAGSGKVCMTCGRSGEDPGNHECGEFDPVRCPECNGGGQ